MPDEEEPEHPPRAAKVLAEATGEPVEKFTPDDDVGYPHPEELERVEVDDA